MGALKRSCKSPFHFKPLLHFYPFHSTLSEYRNTEYNMSRFGHPTRCIDGVVGQPIVPQAAAAFCTFTGHRALKITALSLSLQYLRQCSCMANCSLICVCQTRPVYSHTKAWQACTHSQYSHIHLCLICFK